MIVPPRVVAAGLVVLAAALAVVSPRLIEKRRIERANRTVEICVDLRGAAMVAAADGVSLEAVLTSLRKAGAVSAGVEETLRPVPSLRVRATSPLGEVPSPLRGEGQGEGPSRTLRGTPSGFDPAWLRLIERSGLDPVLRPWPARHPAPWNGGARTDAKSWEREVHAQAGRLVIPAGDEVPGYPDAAAAFGARVASHGGRFGLVEFAEQLGARKAAVAARGAVVVVHSLGEKELSVWEEEGRRRPIRPALLARWTRAARERDVRALYVHPFLRPPLGSTGRLTDVNVQYLGDLAAALRRDGFTVGRAAPWPPFGWPFIHRRGGLLAAQVAALVTTVAAPLLALVVAAAVARTRAGPLAGAAAGAGAALAGGLVVAGVLSGDAFLLRLETFRGVKAGLLLPILIAALYLYRDSFHPGSASWWRERLAAPVKVWQIAAFLALAGAGAALLVRSGNQPGVRLGGTEEGLRLMLEELFGARPRFKEFLFGYPLLVVGLSYLRGDGRVRAGLAPARLWLLGGLVTYLSILNTFAHAHTPLDVSVLRVVHGLWLGLAAGLVLDLAIRRLKR